MKENNKTSRRKFIQRLGIAGVGAASLGASAMAAKPKGQSIKLLTADNKLVEVDSLQLSNSQPDEDASYLNKRGRKGLPNRKFVMVVDLAKCKNAKKCMTACQSAHQLRPDQHHINVLEMTDEQTGRNYFMPKPCQHCDNPSCVTVCPVNATFKRSDGIVLIDNERCIGCRFCVAACPYSARSFNWIEPKDAEKYKDVPYDIEKNVPQKKGTITKCVFSADQLRNKELPYCVSACPNGVYYFGDANEDMVTNGTTKETVRLSALLEDNAAYTLMEELGTKPSVYYLPPRKSSTT